MTQQHRSTPGRALVISDGSVAGLVASAIASEEMVRRENLGVQETPIVLLVPGPGVERGLAAQAVARQCEAYGLVNAERLGAEDRGAVGGSDIGEGLRRSGVLLRAGAVALANGCRRVIWPVQDGEETPGEPARVGQVARELDRALLAGRLVSLEAEDAGLPEVTFETPFVDLSDEQLADLAVDLSVPLEMCWWAGARPLSARPFSARPYC